MAKQGQISGRLERTIISTICLSLWVFVDDSKNE